jgi:hypothetical protein
MTDEKSRCIIPGLRGLSLAYAEWDARAPTRVLNCAACVGITDSLFILLHAFRDIDTYDPFVREVHMAIVIGKEDWRSYCELQLAANGLQLNRPTWSDISFEHGREAELDLTETMRPALECADFSDAGVKIFSDSGLIQVMLPHSPGLPLLNVSDH